MFACPFNWGSGAALHGDGKHRYGSRCRRKLPTLVFCFAKFEVDVDIKARCPEGSVAEGPGVAGSGEQGGRARDADADADADGTPVLAGKGAP